MVSSGHWFPVVSFQGIWGSLSFPDSPRRNWLFAYPKFHLCNNTQFKWMDCANYILSRESPPLISLTFPSKDGVIYYDSDYASNGNYELCE